MATHEDLKNHWRLNAEVVAAAEGVVRNENRKTLPALIAAVGALWADRRRLPPTRSAAIPKWEGGA